MFFSTHIHHPHLYAFLSAQASLCNDMCSDSSCIKFVACVGLRHVQRWFGQGPELVCLPQLHDFLSVDVYFETIHPLESDCLSKQFKTLDTVMRPGALVKTGSCSQQTTTKRLAKNAPAERYALYITHTSILVTPRPPHTGIYLFRHEIVGASGLRHIMRPVHQMSRS